MEFLNSETVIPPSVSIKRAHTGFKVSGEILFAIHYRVHVFFYHGSYLLVAVH
jgi:hypothetical protein